MQKGENMSVTQELGKVQAELKSAELQIEQLEGAAKTSQETIDSQAAQIADLEGQVSTMQGTIDGAEAAQAEAHKELTDQLAGATAQVESLTAENADMKAKLANPAFKAAGVEGEDPNAAGGGSDGGEPGAGVVAQYAKLTGAAKTAFFKAHKAELIEAARG